MNKPKAKDFYVNDGMHCAMALWANTKNKKALTVAVEWSDSSEVFTDTFNRAKKEVSYRTPDGGVYEQEIDSTQFENTYLLGGDSLSKAELKAAFLDWVQPKDPGVSVVKVVWKLC